MSAKGKITQQLLRSNEGDENAFEEIFPLVLRELRQIARAHMLKENRNHTWQTTELINEAYLKLIDQKNVHWQNRVHFFAIASKVMRRILLDHAKGRLREKRGGGAVHTELTDAHGITVERSAEIIVLDESLERLAEFDSLKSRIVEMRYFGGMSVEETAEALGIAPITVIRHWNLAKAWLRREMTDE